MFRVHLRKKKLKNNQQSLYLDFSRPVYHEIKDRHTRREFLNLYIYEKPKTNLQKKHNTAILEVASHRKAATLLAIINGVYGKKDGSEIAKKDFLAFVWERVNSYQPGNTRNAWVNAYKHLCTYSESCTMGDVTKTFLFGFKDYLDNSKLAKNTKRLYFAKISQAIAEAADRGFVEKVEIKNFGVTFAARPFFTDSQVTKLRNTPFPECPDLRRAALFSILTSLRWVDVIPLDHSQIRYDRTMGYYIDFKQKKVDRPDIVYLGKDALELCEYVEGKAGRIFDLHYGDKQRLKTWFALAGVEKPKGSAFHVFRHTFAMRMLNKGERIEVISAMMGHADISTTQIYARLYAETKRDAAHRSTLTPHNGSDND